MALHESDKQYNFELANWINHARDLGLADADVLNLTTVAGLVSAVDGLSMHETNSNLKRHCKSAISEAGNQGILTNTNVAAANTVDGLVDITQVIDANISDEERRTFAFISGISLV